MDLVLFGPPGAGKGTQAVRIREQLDVPQISTGDMMRAARREGTPLGKKFDEYMSAGKLVPDALVLELMKERLSKPDAAKGAIFDGFPRTRDGKYSCIVSPRCIYQIAHLKIGKTTGI